MEDIKYACIVPLVGGMAFGAEKATGKKPEFIVSYPAFKGNDSLLTEYWPDVPYHEIDPETNDFEASSSLPNVDFVAALCPCAGLSQLNNGKKRGADAPQNDWMYKSAEYVLEKIQPKVFWGENAPGLFGPIGAPVAEKLQAIGDKHGYSMTLLKTTTMLHGVPQNRIRSFYFFWKSEVSPILNWQTKERPTIEEFLEGVKPFLDPADVKAKTEELQNDPLFIWLKKEFGDWRSYMKSKKGSMMDVMIQSGKAKEFIEWCSKDYPKFSEYAEHAYNKRMDGKGFWDKTPFLPLDFTGAFTGARMNAIHPSEDRVLTRRELMFFMGLPNDMKEVTQDHMGKVFQNVPSNTAADWTREVIKFIKGELPKAETNYVRQDNVAQKIEMINRVKSVALF
jgi:site-specific DNA-cytosine methylase